MKNKTVESMIRTQFNLDTSTEVNVNFLYSDHKSYTFQVIWFDTIRDIRYETEITLPQIVVLKETQF